MGLFYNNNVAGRGVSKGRKKKPFFRFWELFWRKFWTFFTLNLIYVVACLPIVTFGPATAALTSMMRNIYLERPQFIWHDFWSEFKKNFKQSIVIGIVDLIAAVVALLSYRQYLNTEEMTSSLRMMYIGAFAAQTVFLLMNFYIYPQIAALEMKIGEILKNSVILVFANLPGELIVLAFFMGFAALLMYFTLPAVFFLPFIPGAWMIFLSVFCCYPAIQKLIINPYYEQIGEPNPEIPEWELEGDGESVFADQGGNEEPISLREEKKKGRKIIK